MSETSLRSCNSIEKEMIYQCAEMLVDFWGGSVASREASIIQHPGSYALITTNASGISVAIGYAKVTYTSGVDSSEATGHSAGGIVTSVVINKHYRGKGYGSTMMNLLEAEAVRMGCYFLYLWTSEAVDFYEKLGYRKCPRLADCVSAFRAVDPTAVSMLENMVSSKLSAIYSVGKPLRHPDSTRDSIYLKKRIVDESPLDTSITAEETSSCIIAGIVSFIVNGYMPRDMYAYMISLPWAHQIGPSCGIQAIRMAAAVLKPEYPDRTGTSHQERPGSLLQKAIAMGLSSDGELFDIHSVVSLVENCGFNAIVREEHQLEWDDILSILHPPLQSTPGLIIFPYDRARMGNLPDTAGGRHAHYGVICGYAKSSEEESEQVQGKRDHVFHDHNISCQVVDVVSRTNCLSRCTLHHAQTDELPHKCDIDPNDWRMLIVMHGMDIKPVVAPYTSWKRSNAQLFCGSDAVADASAREWLRSKGWVVPRTGPNLGGQYVIVTSR